MALALLSMAGCASVPNQLRDPARATTFAAVSGLSGAPVTRRAGPQGLQRQVSLTPAGTPLAGFRSPFTFAKQRPESAYGKADLHRSFLSIALRAEAADEYGSGGGITISKWEGPVRYRLSGARPHDREQIRAYAAHLRSLSGLDLREAGPAESHNMDIRFVPPSARAAEVAQLGLRGWLGPSVGALAASWRDTTRDRCFALTTRNRETGVTGTAHIFIKDELDPLWRETCIIEELSQSLGLLNDDPLARPSIFNDDGTYQTLTSHDELLLRILYDPRMRSGMTVREAEPVLRRILDELFPVVRGA